MYFFVCVAVLFIFKFSHLTHMVISVSYDLANKSIGCMSSCEHVRVMYTPYIQLLYGKIGVYRDRHYFLFFFSKT